ncbi:MAG TPA: cupredoxin domain-containing protein, partial [Roseiflexaceae bacterium]|nr:cupredoxin domain-containing protein [Roseiflexaceae bacterium]
MRIILARTLGRVAAFGAALLLAACGTSAANAPAPVRVVATEFRFEPAAITIPVNQATTLTFKNAGQTVHDLTINAGPGIPTPDSHMAGNHTA